MKLVLDCDEFNCYADLLICAFLNIQILRPSSSVDVSDEIRCNGSNIFSLDEGVCCSTSNVNETCPVSGVHTKPPVNYTLIHDIIVELPSSYGYHVIEISNMTGVPVSPGDIMGWTSNNLTGQIAIKSTASSVQVWTMDLPADEVKVGSVFGPHSSISASNVKYALGAYILMKSEMTVNVTYNSPGSHDMKLSLTNAYGAVYQSQTVLVQHPITDLKLLLPEFVLSLKTIVFTLNMTRGTNVTFIWDLGEETNKTIFNQTGISYKYKNAGRYVCA